jgi:hypothetical protein
MYLLDFDIEEGLPMGIWCLHFIKIEKYVWLKKNKDNELCKYVFHDEDTR